MIDGKLLVTGGAGFVGSNLAVSFKKKYPSLGVIALDNLKRRGSELNIRRIRSCGVDFVHGDIRNKEDMSFEEGASPQFWNVLQSLPFWPALAIRRNMSSIPI